MLFSSLEKFLEVPCVHEWEREFCPYEEAVKIFLILILVLLSAVIREVK